MIISRSKNFIYIHIEKTGGTSIEESLTPFLSQEDIILGGQSKGVINENYQYNKYGYDYVRQNMLWKHSDVNDIKKYIKEDWDNLYKFATVRNPKEIMVSFYFYISKNISHMLPNLITNVYYDKNLPQEIIIENSTIYTDDLRDLFFIESIIDGSGIDGFISKMIQYDLKEIAPQITKIDESVELFDLSTIDKSWPIILKKINMPSSTKLLKLNKSNNTGNVQLKEETLQLIYKHFAEDYKIIPQKTSVSWPQ
jgi:hypothetical protein